MNKALLIIALAIGGAIAYVDSRRNWDDTGITAAAILLATAIFGALAPGRPWLWALAVGIWIPLYGIAMHSNFTTLLVLIFAFAGAFAGAGARRTLLPQNKPDPV